MEAPRTPLEDRGLLGSFRGAYASVGWSAQAGLATSRADAGERESRLSSRLAVQAQARGFFLAGTMPSASLPFLIPIKRSQLYLFHVCLKGQQEEHLFF